MGDQKLTARPGVKHIASAPKGETFTGMVLHKDKILVCTENHIYTLEDDNRLERLEIKQDDQSL